MTHVRTKDAAMYIEGPDDNGHYWLHLSASCEACRIDLGMPRGMVETALLMAASVKFGRLKGDYTLAAPLQRIVEGAKTAPQWDTQADRLSVTEAAETALAASEARVTKLVEAAIETYYARQVEWSRETFGPALRTKGIIDHITKELREIAADPHDLSEWIDVVILAMDGFWRHGGKPEDLMPALLAKQAKNMARTWPDWRGMSEDAAIEHDRSKDAAITEATQ